MIFKTLEEFTKSIREFRSQNPGAWYQPKDVPTKLLLGFEAITDDGSTIEWHIPIGMLSVTNIEEINNVVSPEAKSKLLKYAEAKCALRQAETEYVECFIGAKNCPDE